MLETMDQGREPEPVEVVVEIPQGSRNKYEYDHHEHVLRLDRRLFSATTYPTEYGFIPKTLAEDGDPLDALVVLEDPTFPGCRIAGRPVGVFRMRDEAGRDAKVICVPDGDPRWDPVAELADLPGHLLAEIAHFFEIYKDLEPGKGTAIEGYDGRAAALAEIAEAQERYRASGQ